MREPQHRPGRATAPQSAARRSGPVQASLQSAMMQLQKTHGNQAALQMLRARQLSTPTAQMKPSGGDPSSKRDGTYWDKKATTAHKTASVPDHLIAIMKNPADGGTPSVDPPGWDWLKTKHGRLKGKWVRFHLINAKLGGSGGDASNLVPTEHIINHNPAWRNLEDAAKDSASVNQDWTYVEVKMSYNGAFPDGIPEKIDAEWGTWDGANWTPEDTCNLTQPNPDDGTVRRYLPASMITTGRLVQLFDLSIDDAQKLKALIDRKWGSQDAFELAMALADIDTENVKAYVDEEDDAVVIDNSVVRKKRKLPPANGIRKTRHMITKQSIRRNAGSNNKKNGKNGKKKTR